MFGVWLEKLSYKIMVKWRREDPRLPGLSAHFPFRAVKEAYFKINAVV